jgi:hypothetical protein
MTVMLELFYRTPFYFPSYLTAPYRLFSFPVLQDRPLCSLCHYHANSTYRFYLLTYMFDTFLEAVIAKFRMRLVTTGFTAHGKRSISSAKSMNDLMYIGVHHARCFLTPVTQRRSQIANIPSALQARRPLTESFRMLSTPPETMNIETEYRTN